MDATVKASTSRQTSVTAQGEAEQPVSATQKKEDDFRRYLAGQSVMKSGLTRDPKEVERIIAEASKNSKFYLREVEKDRALGKKIEQLVKLKDQLVRNADMDRLERQANEVLAELEAKRDLTQYIVHVDMDAFYANVEVKKDPSLKGKAFGVGSGVLTTASYEARAFGCRSGMAGFVAKKLCPHLLSVKPDFAAYSEASKQVKEVLLEFDENMAMAGMDEGYLNITPYMSSYNMTAAEVVSKLRAEVEARTGLTISAGIAPNTMLAKICSDKNKPNGQYELAFEGKAIREFMSDLPIRRIPGIGRVAERYAASMGVKVCGDIYRHRGVIRLMDKYIGFNFMMKAYLGLGNNVIDPGKREDRKSVGCERTFREKSKDEDILQCLAEIAQNLEEDLKRTGFSGRTVVVKYKLHSYEIFTRQCGAPRYIDKAEEILPLARSLITKELPIKIRLLGIRMTHLKDMRAADTGIQKYFKDSPRKSTKSSDLIDFTDVGEDEDIPELPDLLSDPEAEKPLTGLDVVAEAVAKRKRGPAEEEILTIDEDSDSDIEVLCPVCQKSFSTQKDVTRMKDHIDHCLEKSGARPGKRSKVVADKPASSRSSKHKTKDKPEKTKDVFKMLMKARN